MKRYKVSWTEYHQTIVEAEDESAAFDACQSLDPEISYKCQESFECEYYGEAQADDMDVAHAAMEDRDNG